LLVILDNCEHLLQACAELAKRLLQAGAGVKVLASSREPLHTSAKRSIGCRLWPNLTRARQ
jgi:predicted ATPase